MLQLLVHLSGFMQRVGNCCDLLRLSVLEGVGHEVLQHAIGAAVEKDRTFLSAMTLAEAHSCFVYVVHFDLAVRKFLLQFHACL